MIPLRLSEETKQDIRRIARLINAVEGEIRTLRTAVPGRFLTPAVFAIRFTRVALCELIEERKTNRDPLFNLTGEDEEKPPKP